MNGSQHKAITTALLIIGAMLLFTMLEWGDRIPYAIRVFSLPFYFQEEVFVPHEPVTTFSARMAAAVSAAPKIGLYVRNGIADLLLGLVTPLALWAAAAYVALGSPSKDAGFSQRKESLR